MLKFGHIEYLFLLGSIPVLILFIFLFRRWQRKSLLKFTTENLQNKLYEKKSSSREALKYTLKILAVLFLILGLSNPKIGTNLKEVKSKGIEIVIALDLSNSMLCEDVKPNRLLQSKQAISKLIDMLEGNKVGLVVFAGEAITQLPITPDYSAVKMSLRIINTKTINTQGTNLSAAIRQSVNSFNLENEFNKAIIIITDGEDHEEGAFEQAKLATEKGISIHTLSLGNKNGGPIPLPSGKEYKKDEKGNTIVTKTNFFFLSELAKIGNGININNSEFGLQELFKEISKIEKKEISDIRFTDYSDRFQWFLFISLFLFLLDLSIVNIKNNLIEKWIKK